MFLLIHEYAAAVGAPVEYVLAAIRSGEVVVARVDGKRWVRADTPWPPPNFESSSDLSQLIVLLVQRIQG